METVGGLAWSFELLSLFHPPLTYTRKNGRLQVCMGLGVKWGKKLESVCFCCVLLKTSFTLLSPFFTLFHPSGDNFFHLSRLRSPLVSPWSFGRGLVGHLVHSDGPTGGSRTIHFDVTLLHERVDQMPKGF